GHPSVRTGPARAPPLLRRSVPRPEAARGVVALPCLLIFRLHRTVPPRPVRVAGDAHDCRRGRGRRVLVQLGHPRPRFVLLAAAWAPSTDGRPDTPVPRSTPGEVEPHP